MVCFIDEKKFKFVIDDVVFELEDVKEVYRCLSEKKYFVKVVIWIDYWYIMVGIGFSLKGYFELEILDSYLVIIVGILKYLFEGFFSELLIFFFFVFDVFKYFIECLFVFFYINI